jgi:hypothetical protein
MDRTVIADRWERTVQWLGRALGGRRGRALLALAVLALVGAVSWSVRLAVLPTRRAGEPVTLGEYGYPDVELHLVYPMRVAYRSDGEPPAVLTVYARALVPEAVQPIDLAFPLPDEALAFVDTAGLPAAGRLGVVPGYPDALPYNLLLSHADTQLQPSLLRGRAVRIVPAVQRDSGSLPLTGLAFRTVIESRMNHTLSAAVVWFSGWGVVLAVLALAAGILAGVWHRNSLLRRQAREQRLSALYTRLRDEIKVENWPVARDHVEQLRLIAPEYRDLDRLDTLISTAETAAWRRDQLYRSGLTAYQERDWPAAVQAFSTIEEETPYYRDVRFLRRTAALSADLRSRDRSLRLQAARELGIVADLVDMTPLLHALGDSSREVADAAEASFARIGVDAFDALIGGLTADRLAVRERSFRLLQGLGQSARDRLIQALHDLDPRVTSAVARLLGALGARDVLAASLVWIGAEHQPCVVEALLAENVAAVEPLVDTLLSAPEGREGVILNAIAALKGQADLTHYLEGRLKAAGNDVARERLQRAMRLTVRPFASLKLTAEELPFPTDEPHDPAALDAPPDTALANGRAARRRLWPARRDS